MNPFLHYLEGALITTVCNASLVVFFFSNSSNFKDNNLFWKYPGLCFRSTVNCVVQLRAIKKPANELDGVLKGMRFSLGHVSEHSTAGVRRDCNSPGAIVTFQIFKRKWTNLTHLPLSLSSSSPLLQDRG